MTQILYLGPEGSFTHQAALEAGEQIRARFGEQQFEYTACEDVPTILHAVEHGDGWGVIAWENNVEGFVVPNLDLMIDADDAAGFTRVGVQVQFDAFVTQDTYQLAQQEALATGEDADEVAMRNCTVVTAHSHGLAQCKQFTRAHDLRAVPAASNAAACRDLQTGQIALGPSICAEIYGLHRVRGNVGDFNGARTEFLVIAPREQVMRELAAVREQPDARFESIIAFIPLSTGPGVLANLLDVLRDAQLNMVSLISRPVKGRDDTYSFLATLDAATWDDRFVNALTDICEHGDWVRTLAVYPRNERTYPTVSEWMLPQGGVRFVGRPALADWRNDAAVRKELLW